jgi:uncharacterized protein YbcI
MGNGPELKPRSKSDMEALVDRAVSKFIKKHLGEHSDIVSTRMFEDIVMVRIREVLPPAERHMLRQKDGVRVIKELKMKLLERATPFLKQTINNTTKREVVDVHSSFNPETGEYFEIFTLDSEREGI